MRCGIKDVDTIVFFLTSSGIYAVVILKDGESDSGEETEAVSEKKIGSFAVPQLVMVCVMYLYLSHVAWADQTYR